MAVAGALLDAGEQVGEPITADVGGGALQGVRLDVAGDRDRLRPASMSAELAGRTDAEAELRIRCMLRRQMSLLRSQLKSDLAMYRDDQRLRRLRPDERELLAQCHIHRPWHTVLTRLPVTSSRMTGSICTCGQCGPLR